MLAGELTPLAEPAGPPELAGEPRTPPRPLAAPCGFVPTVRDLAAERAAPPTAPTAGEQTLAEGRSFTTKVKHRNPVFKRHRSIKCFQTLNQAKIVWDPRHKARGLLCGHLNIRSMVNKREQLEDLLVNSNIDCLGLTETWLKHSSPEALVKMPGYNIFRRDRIKGKGGGALLYIRDTLQCEQIEWPKDTQLECVGVKITLSSEMSFSLICLYRHPSATVEFYDQLKHIFNACNFDKEVIVLGDLNINWDDKKCRKKLKEITEQNSTISPRWYRRPQELQIFPKQE